MSLVTYRSHTALAQGATVNSWTVGKPAGTTEGDVLVAVLTYSGGQTAHAVGTGWTEQDYEPDLGGSGTKTSVLTKVAGASEPLSYTFTFGQYTNATGVAVILAYDGADATNPFDGLNFFESTTGTESGPAVAPAVNIDSPGTRVLHIVHTFGLVGALDVASGATERVDDIASSGNYDVAVFDFAPGVSGMIPDKSYPSTTGDTSWGWHTVSLGIREANVAPYAPTVVVADTIDSGATNRFSVPFSDPNIGDTQSQLNLRYWLLDGTGARVGTATTVTKASPNQWWDAPAGAFADGDYEIQGQSYDALGVASGWGPSSFFTATTPTGSPTITDPTSGGTVASDPYTVAWSTAGGQDAYQIRVVADNAGTPDETTVYYDTGQVDDPTSRSAPVPFPDNDVYRHVQVRVYLDGLWSSWGSIRVLVSYTRPPTPTVTPGADDSAGAVVLTYATPEPAAGEPTVTYADVEVRDTSGRDRYRPAAGVRIGAMLTPSGTFIDWLPAAGVNYEYRVVAVGDNGTTSASAWTPIDAEAAASVYYGGGY